MTPEYDDKLVEANLPLVEFIAEKLSRGLPSNVRLEDLLQWGSLGLLDACKKFDPTRENKFKTYAEYRIRGAMLDGLRSQDLKPRSVRDLEKKMDRAREKFEREFSRIPSADELSIQLGFTVDEYYKKLVKTENIAEIAVSDSERFTANDRRALLRRSRLTNGDIDFKIDAMSKLGRIVRDHNSVNRACYILYFVWGLEMIEIAEVFGCTESRISQRIAQVKRGVRSEQE